MQTQQEQQKLLTIAVSSFSSKKLTNTIIIFLQTCDCMSKDLERIRCTEDDVSDSDQSSDIGSEEGIEPVSRKVGKARKRDQ